MAEPKRTLVLLASVPARQVWMGERALQGGKVLAHRMLVELKNGDVEHGEYIGNLENDQRILRGTWFDAVDLSRCHPLPSPRLQQELDIFLAAGKIHREREAKQ